MNEREQALRKELAQRYTQVNDIWEKAGDDAVDETTKQSIITLNKEIEEREIELKEIIDQAAMRAKNAERMKELKQPQGRMGLGGSVKTDTAKVRTIGESVIDDAGFKAWRESMMVGGAVTGAKFGHSPRVAVPGGMKTLITGLSDTSGGSLIYTQHLGLQNEGTFMRPLTIRDIITVGTTGTDTVDFVQMTSFTNNAAPVAEATATSGSSGAKPESAFATELISTTVKTIAHWIPASRASLQDAGQLRTMIDSLLRYGLEEELEDQIINGDGVGQNFTGILNTTGTTAQPYATDLLTTLRQARTKVRITGRATPTAYVLHPNDWEDLDLLKDNEARYYFGGPSVLGSPRLWGLPVVESEAMIEGTGMVADWRLLFLWDREVANILTSDSHADFFIRNMIAILAELRAALGCIKPAAFVEIDLTP